jgi:23S rRNA pseudouridine1911/1915/1917 synthase
MIEILWQTDRLLAIDKPAHLATVPGRGESSNALEAVAKQIGVSRLLLVHRLDKQTSGILLLAKDTEAQRFVCRQFSKREVKKEYLALVAGSPSEDAGEIDAPLAAHPTARNIFTVSKHGRPAITRWEAVQRYRGLSLLRCYPLTGRTHQIRVHLQSIGLPLAIDPVYNRNSTGIFLSEFKRGYRSSGEERPLIDRLTLHAAKLVFQNLDGQPITIESPPPKDFRATINMLSKYARV